MLFVPLSACNRNATCHLCDRNLVHSSVCSDRPKRSVKVHCEILNISRVRSHPERSVEINVQIAFISELVNIASKYLVQPLEVLLVSEPQDFS